MDGGSTVYIIEAIALVVLILVTIFGFVLPDKREKKRQQEALDNIRVGDSVVTIGGLTGKVIQIHEETVVIVPESCESRLEIAKWGLEYKKEAPASRSSRK